MQEADLKKELKLKKKEAQRMQSSADAEVQDVMAVIKLVRETILRRMVKFNSQIIKQEMDDQFTIMDFKMFKPLASLQKAKRANQMIAN